MFGGHLFAHQPGRDQRAMMAVRRATADRGSLPESPPHADSRYAATRTLTRRFDSKVFGNGGGLDSPCVDQAGEFCGYNIVGSIGDGAQGRN
jgi:hypothetical protein